MTVCIEAVNFLEKLLCCRTMGASFVSSIKLDKGFNFVSFFVSIFIQNVENDLPTTHKSLIHTYYLINTQNRIHLT